MKRKRKMIALLVCGAMLLAVGCGGGQKDGDQAAMGRYVESISDPPLTEAFAHTILRRSDGTLDAYLRKDKLHLFHSEDGQNWEEKPVKADLGEVEIDSYVYDQNDTLYVLANEYTTEGRFSKIAEVTAEGEMKEIPLKMNGTDLSINSFAFLQSGDLVLHQSGTGLSQFGKDGTYKGTFGDVRESNIAVFEDTIYQFDSSTGALLGYDGKTRDLIETTPFEFYFQSKGTNLLTGADGSAYAYNQAGFFRKAAGGVLWEKIMDGQLTSLSIPSIYMYNMVEGPGQSFLAFMVEGEAVKLVRYAYDKNVATLPEKELLVYTLEENPTLRQAAGIFQRKYPDTRVNIQVAMSDGAATKQDLIKGLNAELLGGKGPDLVILDGLPIESYIEKGVLADLSGIVKDVNKSKEYQAEILKAYQKKKNIYAVPTRVTMPVMLIGEGQQSQMKDLSSAAAFAKENQSLGLVGDRSPESLLRTFLPVCMPAWISDRGIEQAGLKRFLEDCKTIVDVSAPDYPVAEAIRGAEPDLLESSTAEEIVEQANLFHYAFGRAHGAGRTLFSSSNLISTDIALGKRGDGVLVSLPGQIENPFMPASIAGINAASQQRDGAENLLRIMLQEEVQGLFLGDGFGIKLSSIDAFVARDNEDLYFGMDNVLDKSETLEGGWSRLQTRQRTGELIKAAKNPAVVDSAQMEMVIAEAKGCLSGEKTVEQTVADIKEKMRLHLSE